MRWRVLLTLAYTRLEKRCQIQNTRYKLGPYLHLNAIRVVTVSSAQHRSACVGHPLRIRSQNRDQVGLLRLESYPCALGGVEQRLLDSDSQFGFHTRRQVMRFDD